MEAGGSSMLLTGDIERFAENLLLGKNVKADVLLVPHHGSRTSSTPEFIAAVAPRWAIVPAGFMGMAGAALLAFFILGGAGYAAYAIRHEPRVGLRAWRSGPSAASR